MIKKFEDFRVKHGCVMLPINIAQWNNITSIIKDEDVYTLNGDYGITKDPHITILYGFLDNVLDYSMLESTLKKMEAPSIKFGDITLFEHDNFDVVKIEVFCKDLYKMNSILRSFPHCTDHKRYRPHLTIGFVKKGSGYKYVMPRPDEIPDVYVPKKVIYSSPDKSTKISVKFNER